MKKFHMLQKEKKEDILLVATFGYVHYYSRR